MTVEIASDDRRHRATRLVLVANPENRRCSLFRAEAEAAGLTVTVWPWIELLAGSPPPTVRARWLRVDSPGEDAAVHRHLAGPDVNLVDVGPLSRWYRRFLGAIDRCIAALPGLTCLNPPAEVRLLFDKAACHRHLASAGVPVPPTLGPVWSYRELRHEMDLAGWHRVFVKPRHGSSASGVVALTAVGRRVSATTTAVLVGDPPRPRNRLGLRTITDPATVEATIDGLAPDGLHIERWYPKLIIDDRVVDVRVVVIAGEPTHVVVRSAGGPITNLHLGNRRGEVSRVIAAVGTDRWEAALDTCRAVSRCFPGSLHLGVDVLLSADGRGHAIAEVNAFGDLLPGVTHRGRSTYAEEVDALLSGRFRPLGEPAVPVAAPVSAPVVGPPVAIR